MPARRRFAIVIALSFVAFLLAATGHGRQLRAEREAHGFLQMDPVQGWPPVMHEIWQLDRARLKAGAAAAAVVVVIVVGATGAGLKMGALAVLLWAPTLGFIFGGALSLLRLWGHEPAAATATLPGATAFFGATLLSLIGSVVLGVSRRDVEATAPGAREALPG